ncbi:bacterioferritin-associated ferredoxin [Rheinheimera sp.]|uniref:bacterioferritin-associated ferredoxin n=1 Tax=Rheinheimera sp. TaxID=1869214 RepID=UPI003AF52FF7
MYVCLCKAVTDKAIRQQVAEGATSMREIRKQLGVGSQCGQCVCEANQVFSEALSKYAALQISCLVLTETRPAA